MKRNILSGIGLCMIVMLQAQVNKTINVTAGNLSSGLTTNEKTTVTNLTVTGTMDARDFKTLRDSMPALTSFDLNSVVIAAYTGTKGTASTSNTTYPANAIPVHAFCNPATWAGKIKLATMTLPSSITAIGNNAFAYCTGLTSVTIPSSVTSLGNSPFQYCNGLISVTIPSSLTSISTAAFMNCYNLTSLTLPSTLTDIGSYAFRGCSEIANLTIPSSVTSIGECAFSSCNCIINVEAGNQYYSSSNGILFDKTKTKLIYYPIKKAGTYTIPSTVVTVETYAFSYCDSLSGITIPSSVTSIGSSAFSNCKGLSSITIPASVTTIGYYTFSNFNGSITVDAANPNYCSNNGVLYNKTKTTLIQCPVSLTGSFAIPSTVTSVLVQAFYNCSALTSVSIPSSVTSIESNTFYLCSNLTSVYAYANTPIDLSSSSNVFGAVNKSTCILYVPTGRKSVYEIANQWKDFTKIVEFNPLGIEETATMDVNIYPNPTASMVNLSHVEKTTNVNITNSSGQIIWQGYANQFPINIATWDPGMYLVQLEKNGKTLVKKIVKK